MPATEPEQIHGRFEQAFNAGDIEALVALYEPDAALVPAAGRDRGRVGRYQRVAALVP
jgi:ketosteroid isomerase-like protein